MNLAEHNSQSDNQTDYWWNHVTDINIYYPKGPITQFKCWANYYTQWKNRYIEVWRGLVGTCTNKPLTLLDFICIGRWYLFLTRLNTSHFVYFSSIIAVNKYFLNRVIYALGWKRSTCSTLCIWLSLSVNVLHVSISIQINSSHHYSCQQTTGLNLIKQFWVRFLSLHLTVFV